MKGFVNPLQMGLLGGIAAWANTLDKSNLLNQQLEASKERYKSRYDAMAAVQSERAKNNQLLQAMKVELGQRQQKNLMTDDNGNQYWSIGHKVADPANPDQWTYHEDARMTPEQYSKTFGPKSSTASPYRTVGGSLVDTSKLDANGNPTAVYTAPDKQGPIQARQLTLEAQRNRDVAQRQKDAQDRADLNKKVERVDTLTNKDLDKWDKAGTDADKLQMLKNAGVDVPSTHPGLINKATFGYVDTQNPPTADEIDAKRDDYETAMRAKHAKDLGVPLKAVNEGGVAPAVPAEGDQPTGDGDTTIRTGADGKKYKILGTDPVTGKIQAEPLAMDQVDLGDDATAQAQPEEQAPDPFENDNSDLQGLLAQYQQQSDQGYQDQMNQLAAPDEEDQPQGLMAG